MKEVHDVVINGFGLRTENKTRDKPEALFKELSCKYYWKIRRVVDNFDIPKKSCSESFYPSCYRLIFLFCNLERGLKTRKSIFNG